MRHLILYFTYYLFHRLWWWAAGVIEQEGFWVHQELFHGILQGWWQIYWASYLLWLRCLNCPSASLECAGSCSLIKQRRGSNLSQASDEETKILVAMARSPMMFRKFLASWSGSIFCVHKYLKEVLHKVTFKGAIWPSLAPTEELLVAIGDPSMVLLLIIIHHLGWGFSPSKPLQSH